MEEKTVPDSQVEFSLELISHLPLDLGPVSLQVSLNFAPPKKAPPAVETDRRKGRGVQRSPSAASNSNTSVLR
jgi:hypothetical protein